MEYRHYGVQVTYGDTGHEQILQKGLTYEEAVEAIESLTWREGEFSAGSVFDIIDLEVEKD